MPCQSNLGEKGTEQRAKTNERKQTQTKPKQEKKSDKNKFQKPEDRITKIITKEHGSAKILLKCCSTPHTLLTQRETVNYSQRGSNPLSKCSSFVTIFDDCKRSHTMMAINSKGEPASCSNCIYYTCPWPWNCSLLLSLLEVYCV